MEIIQERLEREYELGLITTAPTVVYQVELADGTVLAVANPSAMPDPGQIKEIREPYIRACILGPQEAVGSVISLCIERRGLQQDISYHGRQVMLEFDIPLSEAKNRRVRSVQDTTPWGTIGIAREDSFIFLFS